jgi:transcription-repair coupling factor (superfamily II helicase)
MLDPLRKTPHLATLQKALLPGHPLLFEGLWDAPKAFLAAAIFELTKQPLLLITGGVREDTLFDNLSYFVPGKIIEFPAWETLPGEEILPSPDILGKRFDALHTLLTKKEPSIILCPLSSLLQKVIPSQTLAPLFSIWKKNTHFSFQTIASYLTSLGYKRSAVVSDKGEFALRGGILDLFPVSSTDPFRIEFFDDEIEEIRIFDPIGQKTIKKADEVFICPAQELLFLKKEKELGSLVDYLKNPIFLWDDLVALENTYVSLSQMPGAKSPFFSSLKEFFEKNKTSTQIFCSETQIEELSEVKKMKEGFISFEMFQLPFQTKRCPFPCRKIHLIEDLVDPHLQFLFLSSNETEEEEMKKQFLGLKNRASFEKGYLTSGFAISDLAVVPYSEITHKKHIRRQKWRSTAHTTPAAEFHQLNPNDLVVHFHSGIGRYLGIEEQLNHLGQKTEFLSIEYEKGAKLFVPISQSYLISRYIGASDESPPLSQLGNKRWQQIRSTAQTQIVGYANDLLQLYAQRATLTGFRYPENSDMMEQFEKDFPYKETEDQLLAMQEIINDMLSEKIMDRLICGDVGYGKTEVAMRAAFKAIVDGGKQVTVLVPTTVLAMQHFDTFSQRMGGFPVRVGVVSRFISMKEAKNTLEKVIKGEIDLLIGTHRLLSQDVKFKNLGLIIIDEEQRFGVRAKEHLKKLKLGVDCLTLSATPIPRTLYMSLVQARDMSVINTPPQDRLPIKTIIAETDDEIIQSALLRELSRGGQAFYIHNRVETIYGHAEKIQKLCPTAKIGIVHGQMDPEDVDQIFHQFKQNEIDILFATTIIENGIDVPNANTILIDRADTYGLADLYQLRGRVGRWNRAAYSYFLIPKKVKLSLAAHKRLNALVEAGGYGGGMKIAMRDLEIRGAGDILGIQQSGQVAAIGFHLYCKLLKRSIAALKAKKPISFNETKMEFPFDARLPESYIDAVSVRMEIYHRLGEATNGSEIDELFIEIKDRFGPPPPPVLWLYHMNKIRAFASAHHFISLKFGNLSLIAERQRGNETEKTTILLPKKIQSPEELETYVIQRLIENSADNTKDRKST